MGTQVRFRVCNNRFGRIAGHLTHGHRQRSEFLAGALLPGFCITLGLVLFDEDEVRHRLDGHQTDLRMEGLILAERNLAGRHLGGEPSVFFLAETNQQRLHLLGHRLLSSVGWGDEFVQTAQVQKPTQVAQATIVGLQEDQVGSREQSMEEVEPVRRFQEPRHALGPGTVFDQSPLAANPVLQRPRGNIQFACNPAVRGPGRIQGLELGHLLRHPPAGPKGRFLRATCNGTIEYGIHGLGLLQWLLLTTIESPNLGAKSRS